MRIQIERLSKRAVFVALLGNAGCGCGPTTEELPTGDEAKRYAEKVCGALDDCGCYNHFGSPSLCEDEMESRFAGLLDDEGLDLDLDCFELMNSDTIEDCTTVPVGPDEWRCTVLRGDQRLGEPCTDHDLEIAPFEVNDCAKGLTCWNGHCIDENESPPNLNEGDPCTGDAPLTCIGITTSLYCSAENVCALQPKIGEPCDSPFACALDIADDGTSVYCAGIETQGIGTCAAQATYGEACDPRDAFACSAAGDPRGAWCDPDGTCVAGSPGICRFMDFPRARPTSG
jgi:hypothetical protein